MKNQAPSYPHHRFPAEILSQAVWLSHRVSLSFREVEELLAERGITGTYEAIRQWCWKCGPNYARKLTKRQGRLGGYVPTNWGAIASLSARSCPGCHI